MTSRQRCSRRYSQSQKGRDCLNRYRTKHPEIIQAITKVNNAVRDGKLIPAKTLNCHFCSKQAEQYHHKSYAPEHRLEVIPVCRKCHKILTITTSRIAAMFANTVGLFYAHRVGDDRNVYATGQDSGLYSTLGCKKQIQRHRERPDRAGRKTSPRCSLTGENGKHRSTVALLGTYLPLVESKKAACKGVKQPLNRKLGCKIPKTLFDEPELTERRSMLIANSNEDKSVPKPNQVSVIPTR